VRIPDRTPHFLKWFSVAANEDVVDSDAYPMLSESAENLDVNACEGRTIPVRSRTFLATSRR
jgi:hypothetical protein